MIFAAAAAMAAMTATVKKWVAERGFGFLTPSAVSRLMGARMLRMRRRWTGLLAAA